MLLAGAVAAVALFADACAAKGPFFNQLNDSTWVIGNDHWNVTQNHQYATKLYWKGKDLVGDAWGHYVSYSMSSVPSRSLIGSMTYSHSPQMARRATSPGSTPPSSAARPTTSTCSSTPSRANFTGSSTRTSSAHTSTLSTALFLTSASSGPSGGSTTTPSPEPAPPSGTASSHLSPSTCLRPKSRTRPGRRPTERS